jgi:hypothetical protein
VIASKRTLSFRTTKIQIPNLMRPDDAKHYRNALYITQTTL